MDKFLELRDKYPEFIYDSYTVNETDDMYEITYVYKIGELTFKPNIVILKKDISNKNISKEYLDYLFFQYGLFDLMSYYKLTCSKKIIIKPMYIDKESCEFFKKVLYNGLGEYMYRNNIQVSYDEFTTFEVVSDKKYVMPEFKDEYIGNLIPIGGGKDSIVTMELLKGYKDNNKVFMLDRNIYPKNKAGYDSIKMAGYNEEDIVIFTNNMDTLMLDLNKQGYLNGHIPISACISMASLIMAYLNNKKYIPLSNEASANEGNFVGLSVNHQYSKSFEYEADFRNYAKKYLNPYISYFSFLRGWNESEIIDEFLRHKEYLSVFRSCNRGTRENKWCNHCSKCLYVYIMLYPYLTKEELSKVFDHDLLDDKDLEEDFIGLIDESKLKPFECVGTRLEINYALQKSLNKEDLPYLLRLYKDKYMNNPIDSDMVKKYFNKDNNIPEEYMYLFGDKYER